MFGLRIIGTIVVLVALFFLVRSIMRDGGGGGGGPTTPDPSPRPKRGERREPAGRA